MSPKSLFELPHVFKLPQLLLAFIIMFVVRFGNVGSNFIPLDSMDSYYFVAMTAFGFFIIILVQIGGIAGGDKAIKTNILFALFGCIFYLAAGSVAIDTGRKLAGRPKDSGLAAGCLMLMQSALYLVDLLFSGMKMKKEE